MPRGNTYEILEVKWLRVKAKRSTVQVLDLSCWLFPKVLFFPEEILSRSNLTKRSHDVLIRLMKLNKDDEEHY